MVYAPIWKDTYYTATSVSSLTYSIKSSDGSTTYFNGKAIRMPDSNTIEINVNEICKNFMDNDLPDFRSVTGNTSYTNTNACKTFKLYSGSTVLETYCFLWDWSGVDWNGSNKSMSYPINGHNNGSMLVFSSKVSAQTVTNSITTGSANTCGDFALYYQCAAGGWCSFLIEGNVKRTDTLTDYKYSKVIKNTSNDFENTKYSTDVKESYQLYTGWLSDEQAANLAQNLLESTRVYAHNFKTNKIFPVLITDANPEYKTFRNLGKKKVNYVINITASKTSIRR